MYSSCAQHDMLVPDSDVYDKQTKNCLFLAHVAVLGKPELDFQLKKI